MTDASIGAWESELHALLEKLRSHPSAELAEERLRVVVLEKLIADYYRARD
ncbi:MAG: hypothetical protein KGL44_03310 [Sphingomonadales bacterium]|nr:hypothetical protein [Sphingomonadales bacterium]